MKKFTIVFFFLMVGVGTMMAQSVLKVPISSEFMIVLDEKPEPGTILEFDISQFNFPNEARAKRVIAGVQRGVVVDFDAKTARMPMPERILSDDKFGVSEVNRLLQRMGKTMQLRASKL